jgi:hypothetical protein
VLDYQIETKHHTKEATKKDDIVKEKEYYKILKKRDDDRYYSRLEVEKKLKTDVTHCNRILIEIKQRKSDLDRSQIIDEARQAAKKDEDALTRQNNEKINKRLLEKNYLATVLKTQIESKTVKGEKRAEVMSNILRMNKLPYKISNFGKSEL